MRSIIPAKLLRMIREKINLAMRRIKSPRMISGYMDSSGEWRPKTRISDTAFFYHQENIKISNNVFVGHYTIIDGTGGLEIGEGTQLAAWAGIFTHSSHIAIRIYGKHYQDVPESEKQGYAIKNVIIGKYVFIGARALVLPGVSIGDGALVEAGSIVRKDVNAFDIVSGNPAEVVGDTRKMDKPYLEDPNIKSWYEEWQKT